MLLFSFSRLQAVQTRLENPTRYHLEQISRKQSLIAEETPAQILQHEESSPDSEFTSEVNENGRKTRRKITSSRSFFFFSDG